MTRSRRPSAQTTAVVLALAEEPTAWRYGYQLCQQLDIKPGSLYPILMRLTDRGLLETTWDTDVPAGRPPRHLYRLTGSGRALATELAATATARDGHPTVRSDRRGGRAHELDPTQACDRHDLGRRGGVGGVLRRRSRDCRPATRAGDRRGATGRPAAAVGGAAADRLGRRLAARLVLRHWWSGAGSRMSAMDPPGRLLAAAVAALPERRREWGSAMLAELAEVRGRSARWRFALSSARATLWLPPAGGWPVLALVTGAVVASVAAVGPAVGAAVPGLTVFAVTFTGLVGAMVVLAVARSRRLRLPVPVPTVLVTGGVAASIAVTVIFLRREPAAAQYLPPAAAVYLAAVLAGCLWVAVAPPRWLGANRLAPHLGAAAAVVFAAWSLLDGRTLDGELVTPVGVNLADAVVFCLGILPVFGLTLGLIGAALGARRAVGKDPAQGPPHPTM